MFILPQFVVTFHPFPDVHRSTMWVCNGDDEVEALCKILRWNGITTYAVSDKPDLTSSTPPERDSVEATDV